MVKKWDKNLEEKVEKVLGNRPTPESDFSIGFVPREARRLTHFWY